MRIILEFVSFIKIKTTRNNNNNKNNIWIFIYKSYTVYKPTIIWLLCLQILWGIQIFFLRSNFIFSHIYIVIICAASFYYNSFERCVLFCSLLNSIIKIPICSICLFKMYRKKCFDNKSKVKLLNLIHRFVIHIFIFWTHLISIIIIIIITKWKS